MLFLIWSPRRADFVSVQSRPVQTQKDLHQAGCIFCSTAPFQSFHWLKADWALITFARKHQGSLHNRLIFPKCGLLHICLYKGLSFLDLRLIKESFSVGISKTGFLITICVFIRVAQGHYLVFCGNVSKTTLSCWF